MSSRRQRLTAIGALLIGLVLLGLTLRHVDVVSLRQFAATVGAALPLMLLPGLGWHIARTLAWHRCFPAQGRPPLATTARVRLAAEAFSYLTISGVAGEPLKVLLLASESPAAQASAAIALERVAYLAVTAVLLAAASTAALMTLPLARVWSYLFLGIAALSAASALLLLIVWKRARAAGPWHDASPDSGGGTRLRRFARDFIRQFRALAHAGPRDLGLLIALETAAFLMMTLEVYVVLLLTGHGVSPLGAAAVETLTRVASLVSAFIPANLGALEASNIAAANAVHAAGGAVALALVRRIRGLAFCATGLLVYPRVGNRNPTPSPTAASTRTLMSVQTDDSDAFIARELGGMPAGERIARAAFRAGYTRLIVRTPRRETEWRAATRRVGVPIEIVATADAAVWNRLCGDSDGASPLPTFAPGTVASPRSLARAGQPDGDATAMALPSASLGIRTPAEIEISERLLRESIFKPTDGRVGRFNRRFSIPISIWLIRHTRSSAHAMSLFVMILGLSAGWLFARGTYVAGVIAALVSLAASVLDGCDGELARFQYKDSAFGCWVDTLGDYAYYIAIFSGLTIGAARRSAHPVFWWWSGGLLCAGVLLTFGLLILLRWRATDGQPEHLRSRAKSHFYGTGKRWARIVARLSTCATRATMPYGILAFALAGLLPVIVVLATIGAQIYWMSLAREFGTLLKNAGAPPGADPVRAVGSPTCRERFAR